MPQQHTYSIESLQAQRKSLQQQLEENKNAIAEKWTQIFAAPQATDNKIQMLVSQAERAYAVYDGVMLGYKLFRRFNSFISIFHKKKKKK